jgi:hypothetical protein
VVGEARRVELFVPRIEAVCRAHGLEPPIICTPEELQIKEEP